MQMYEHIFYIQIIIIFIAMKKLIYTFLLSLICFGVYGQGFVQMGNKLERTTDGYKYRTNLGGPGFAYWYTKPQIDSILALTQRALVFTLPLSVTSNVVSIRVANGSQSGYLSSTDWNAFNGKQNTVTLGSTAQYLRGDLSLATFPTSLPPNGPAGGDLSGNYPNPSVATFNGQLPSYYLNYNNFTNKPTSMPPSGAASGDLGGTYPGPTVLQINGVTKSFYDPTSSIQTQLNNTVLISNTRNGANFGLTASLANVSNKTVTGDQTYRVGGWINLLSVSGGDAVTMQVTWTDNHSVSKTKTFYIQGSSTAALSTVDDYAFPTMDFRALSGTTVQVSTTVTGTGTILYEAGCTITVIQGI